MSVDTLEAQEVGAREGQFYSHVAEMIGGDVTPGRVRRVIERLNSGKHLVHGIFRDPALSRIEREGIRPITPEGGYVSDWTTGTRVFGHPEAHGPIAKGGYDTSFFHYAHTPSNELGHTHMSIAMTNGDLFKEVGEVYFMKNSMVELPFPVPREKMALLLVEMKGGGKDDRTSRQRLEQTMFGLLEEVLEKSYRGGEAFRRSVTI